MNPTTTHHVPSDRDPHRVYLVSEFLDGTIVCTCPDYELRQAPRGGQCKHIRRIVAGRRVSALRERLAALPDRSASLS